MWIVEDQQNKASGYCETIRNFPEFQRIKGTAGVSLLRTELGNLACVLDGLGARMTSKLCNTYYNLGTQPN